MRGEVKGREGRKGQERGGGWGVQRHKRGGKREKKKSNGTKTSLFHTRFECLSFCKSCFLDFSRDQRDRSLSFKFV